MASDATATVTAFEQTCAAMADPVSARGAADALTALRGDREMALRIARAVLEAAKPSASVPAQLQALLLLRDVVLRWWAVLPAEECVGLRTWALTLAANRWSEFSRPVATSIVVFVAVLWKRGWMDFSDGRAMLANQLEQLFTSPHPQHCAVASSLALALVQEFDASAGGRAMALGVNTEFHHAAAASFASTALHAIFSLAARTLLSRLTPATLHALASPTSNAEAFHTAGADLPLIASLLAVLSEVLAWDWTGRWGAGTTSTRGGSRAMLGSPGKAWSDVLGDTSYVLPRALLALVHATREHAFQRAVGGSSEMCETVHSSSRGLLAALASVRPDMFTDAASYAAHTRVLLDGFVALLRTTPVDVSTERGGGSDAADACDTDTIEISEGINTLLWVAGVPRLLAARIDVRVVVDAVTSRATTILNSIDVAAAAAASASAAAKSAVVNFLSSRYASSCAALDALLEVWGTVSYFVQPSGSGEVDDGGDGQGLSALQAQCRSLAAGLFTRLVRARLSMASAIVRLEIDDDDPFEDRSTLDGHLTAVAALARLAPAETLTALSAGVDGALARLKSIAVAGCAQEADDVARDVASEEAWWLVSYAGYVLADEARGETPVVPYALLTLASSSATGGNGAPHAVVTLSANVAALLHFQTGLLLQERRQQQLQWTSDRGAGRPHGAHVMPSQTLKLSPLLTERLLWFASRWARTYLFPQLTLYSVGGDAAVGTSRLPADIVAAFSERTDDVNIISAVGAACVSNDGLRTVPIAPTSASNFGRSAAVPLGGRQLLELVISAAAACLAAWGNSEPGVAQAAVWTLRAVVNNEHAARFATLSPAWAELTRATVKGICSGTDSVATSASTASSSSSSSSALAALLPDSQGALVALLLCATRMIGFEGDAARVDSSAAWEALSEAARGGSCDPDVAIGRAADSVALNVASRGSRTDDMAFVVARWRAYYDSIVHALHVRFRDVVASPRVIAALAGARVPTATSASGFAPLDAVAVSRELDRLLAMLTGVVNANARLPDAWHFGTTTAALASCAQLVSAACAGTGSAAAGGGGPIVTRCLRYVSEFLDADIAALDEAQARAVYGAVAAVFAAYATHRSAPPSSLNPTLTRSSSSSSSAATAAAAEAEAAGVDDLLLLLQVLDKVADKEDLDLGTIGESGTASRPGADGGSASGAVLAGLRYLLPLLTPSLLASYPTLGAAFVGLVSRLICGHPLQIATYADAATFGVFLAALEWAVSSAPADVAVPISALDAIRALAAFHGACRRKNAGNVAVSAASGLNPQLRAFPTLFARLTSILLTAVLGPVPPDRAVIPAAGDALFALVSAEPEAFNATVAALLQSRSDATASARLAAEFNSLTTANGVTLDVSSRANKSLWATNFARFVDRVRSFTTMN